jgi:predicted MFS family arabinose efflux permease
VTLLLLLGHQVMYTYVAPFAEHAGFGHTGLVLLVFGVATVVGIWIVGALVDAHLRRTLLTALALIACAMAALAVSAGDPLVLLVSVALWGAAFGGAPTLIQTALVDASGPPTPTWPPPCRPPSTTPASRPVPSPEDLSWRAREQRLFPGRHSR